mmetsp:Transcript_96505/g.272887  ORF Transcript_96505/g.272887 Transcript_96505/m.272887 type:complete len:243 (-) Transcript_96505:722-1450(-)
MGNAAAERRRRRARCLYSGCLSSRGRAAQKATGQMSRRLRHQASAAPHSTAEATKNRLAGVRSLAHSITVNSPRRPAGMDQNKWPSHLEFKVAHEPLPRSSMRCRERFQRYASRKASSGLKRQHTAAAASIRQQDSSNNLMRSLICRGLSEVDMRPTPARRALRSIFCVAVTRGSSVHRRRRAPMQLLRARRRARRHAGTHPSPHARDTHATCCPAASGRIAASLTPGTVCRVASKAPRSSH